MKQDDRQALRLAVIAGTVDCALSVEEAAVFMGVSESWLRRSDVPRINGVGHPKYLKSQCLAYLQTRLSHRINAA